MVNARWWPVVTMLGATALAAPQVSLSVAAQTPCVTEQSLTTRLVAEGVAVVEQGSLDVDVSPSGAGLRLRARRLEDGRLLVRVVPSRGACASVEAAVVMLIREWASSSASASPPAGERVGETRARPAPVRRLPVGEPVAVVVEVVPVVEVVAPVVAVTPPPLPVAREPEAPDASVAASTAAPVLPSPRPSPQGEREVVVGVLGGVSSGLVPNGSLLLDVGRTFGGTLDASLEGTSLVPAAPGQLALSLQWMSLFARWRFTLGRVALDLALGARGSRLTVTASGFSTNGTATLLGLGPAAAFTGWVHLVGPLHFLARVSGDFRLPIERVTVTNGPTVELTSWHLAAQAGLALAWP